MASETKPMETHGLLTSTAGMADIIRIAKNVTEPLRAAVVETPRRSSQPEVHPPAKLPRPDTTNGIHAYLPMDAMSKCRAFFRYSGNQKM